MDWQGNKSKLDDAHPQDGSPHETQRPIKMEKTDWNLPIDTRGMNAFELAKRVRFESNNVIRYLTEDNRDILFLLKHDRKVRKISEVQLENFIETDGHQLISKFDQEPLAEMKQRNR